MAGGHYQEQESSQSRIWIPELELGLELWQGEYQGISRQWLRWLDEEGWVPTDTEQAQQKAEQAQFQLQQVVLNLLQSGMADEQVARLTGLSKAQVRQLVNEGEM